MRDHQIAALVNSLLDCAVEFRDAQQLRERIAALVVPALRDAPTPDTYLADAVVRYMTEIGRANKGIRRLRRKLDRALEDIDDLSGACSLAWAAAAKAEPLRAPTPQDCVDIAEWHKSECEACCINPSESEDYGRAMVDAVRLVLVDGAAAALQRNYSGITAGAENRSQVVDFGAAAQNRTADLLITNQGGVSAETAQNQQHTSLAPPVEGVEVASIDSSTCDTVTAGLPCWNEPWSIERSGGGWVRSVVDRNGNAVCYGSIDEVPARLIRSAPELVRALAKIAAYPRQRSDEMSVAVLRQIARAALHTTLELGS